MKKIVLILSAIMLTWNVGLANNPVTGVKIDKSTIMLEEGKTQTLKGTVLPDSATNKTVKWSSDKPNIAKIGETDGKVTAVKAGTAKITVTTNDGNHTATCTVTVKAKEVQAAAVKADVQATTTVTSDVKAESVVPTQVTDPMQIIESYVKQNILKKVLMTTDDVTKAIEDVKKNIQSLEAKNGSLNSEIVSLKTEKQKLEEENKALKANQKSVFYKYASYVLGGIAFILFILLFFIIKNKNKELKKQRRESQSKFENLEEWKKAEKGGLENRINTLTADNKNLDAKVKELQAELYRIRQNGNNAGTQSAPVQLPPQPQSLYADAIIDGQFHKVTEQPDSRSIFELRLAKAGDTQAKVTIYEAAYGRVIANPAFLEGCEKQILGSTIVKMQKDGVATKDSSGKWNISTTPEVVIS